MTVRSTTWAATSPTRSSGWTTGRLLDTPDEELPSSRFRRAKVYVDCNSFGPRAIEAAVGLYGADRIVCGTDGSAFGVDWTRKALAEAQISDEAREQILQPERRGDDGAGREGGGAANGCRLIAGARRSSRSVHVELLDSHRDPRWLQDDLAGRENLRGDLVVGHSRVPNDALLVGPNDQVMLNRR